MSIDNYHGGVPDARTIVVMASIGEMLLGTPFRSADRDLLLHFPVHSPTSPPSVSSGSMPDPITVS